MAYLSCLYQISLPVFNWILNTLKKNSFENNETLRSFNQLIVFFRCFQMTILKKIFCIWTFVRLGRSLTLITTINCNKFLLEIVALTTGNVTKQYCCNILKGNTKFQLINNNSLNNNKYMWYYKRNKYSHFTSLAQSDPIWMIAMY